MLMLPWTSHFKQEKCCPAWGVTCKKYNLKDHFKAVCLNDRSPKGPPKKGSAKGKKESKMNKCYNVEGSDEDDDSAEEKIDYEQDFAFGVCALNAENNMIPVIVGGADYP
jgi:hypothetical protein